MGFKVDLREIVRGGGEGDRISGVETASSASIEILSAGVITDYLERQLKGFFDRKLF
jgi:hypothetical protein